MPLVPNHKAQIPDFRKFSKKFLDFRKFYPVQKNRNIHFAGDFWTFHEILTMTGILLCNTQDATPLQTTQQLYIIMK